MDRGRPAVLPRADGASGRARPVLPAAGERARTARRSANSRAGRRAIFTFLEGMWMRRPGAAHCRRGRRGAGADARRRRGFRARRGRTRCPSTAGGRSSTACGADADRVEPGLAAEIAAELDVSSRLADATCRRASSTPISSPTTSSSSAGELSGLIDFYFACNDILAYDLAICLNAWCFEPDGAFNVTKGRAMIEGYRAVRPLSAAEIAALPILARGAAHALPADAALRLAERARRQLRDAEGPAANICASCASTAASTSAAEYGIERSLA